MGQAELVNQVKMNRPNTLTGKTQMATPKNMSKRESISRDVAVSTPSTTTTARRAPHPSVRRAGERSFPRAGAADKPARMG